MLIQLPLLSDRQQKRREAEERRSSERRLERRSWATFILVCCIEQCYKRWLRFCCFTFLLVYYFGNAKIHCIFSKMKRNFLLQLVWPFITVRAGFMIYKKFIWNSCSRWLIGWVSFCHPYYNIIACIFC